MDTVGDGFKHTIVDGVVENTEMGRERSICRSQERGERVVRQSSIVQSMFRSWPSRMRQGDVLQRMGADGKMSIGRKEKREIMSDRIRTLYNAKMRGECAMQRMM
ncbi:hypothetical protein FRC15_004818 [Serendipita sp. 397]|nr:hypothetical protein FRC15_004818 [Serendipita sp. 397]